MHPRRRLATSLLPALLGLTACAGASSEAEPKASADAPQAKPDDAKPDDAKPEGASETKPSNEPAQAYAQRWSSATGQASASLAAVADGRAYAIAGPYMEFGMPATHLVCLSLDDGALLWDHETDAPMILTGLSSELIEVEAEDGRQAITIAEGKAIEPTKAQSDALAPPPKPPESPCKADGPALSCPSWTVEEAGDISALRSAGEALCYAVAGVREVRCRASQTGDLELLIPVPAVEKVKEPGAVNFSFERLGDQIIVANYDGSVLAFGPAGS